MKRITVYNEKGGCGKTTVTVLLASYLASEGHRVAVMDFDAPIHHISTIREEELRDPSSFLLQQLKGGVSVSASVPYEVRRMVPLEDGTWDLGEIVAAMDDLAAEGTEYLLCDYPGRYSPLEPVSLMAAGGLLDFAAVPVEADSQTMKSALVMVDALKGCGVSTCAFWNRIPSDELNTPRLQRAEEVFSSYGIEVIPERMRLARVVSHDSRIVGFLRSTMHFPRRTADKGGWLVPFLESLKNRIDRI